MGNVRRKDSKEEHRSRHARRDSHPRGRSALRLEADGGSDAVTALAHEPSIDVARRCFGAFNRNVAGRSDACYALLDAEVEWTPITALLDGRAYRGPEGVRRWVDEIKRVWRVYETRWTEARDLGDGRILAFGVWDSLGRVGGVEMGFDQAAWLIEVRAGKLIRLEAFADRGEALEAAALGRER